MSVPLPIPHDYEYRAYAPYFVSHETDGQVKFGQFFSLRSAIIAFWREGVDRKVIVDSRGVVILGVDNHHDPLDPYQVGTREALEETLTLCGDSELEAQVGIMAMVDAIREGGGSIR